MPHRVTSQASQSANVTGTTTCQRTYQAKLLHYPRDKAASAGSPNKSKKIHTPMQKLQFKAISMHHRQKVPKHRKHLRSFAWSSGGGPCDGGHSSIMEMAMDTHLIMQLALTTWWAPSLDQTYVQVKIFQCRTDQKGFCWLLSWHCPLPKVSHPHIDLINAMFTISIFTISTCNAINTKIDTP